jgi:nitrogen regulation protein NR(I)
MAKILVVDDEEMIRFAFEQFLNDEGYTPLLARDGEAGLELMRTQRPEIIFLDYRLPEKDGLDLLEEITGIDPKTPVVFMTAFGAMDVAIKAMQLGAYEYLSKPLDLEKIRVVIERILEEKKSFKDIEPDHQRRAAEIPPLQMVGKGPAMQEIFKMIGLLTTQDVTVLITGESGVGKELVARAIHENSPRGSEPFVAVNCGAMPETLLEAEMFGYEKGAFTGAEAQKQGRFEVAGGGTIFLDEIGELQLPLQVKLLRVLQERTFERVGGNVPIRTHARVMAATNKDLNEEVLLGRFRKDLFYRLHLIQVHLPPLRERREDIPLLVDHFIQLANIEMGRKVRGITDSALQRLQTYYWPGNARELENQIKRAMVLSREDVLSEHLFELDLDRPQEFDEDQADRLAAVTRKYLTRVLLEPDPAKSVFEQIVAVVEEALIREALERTGGNQAQAAQLLGMHRSTLRKKKKDYDM